MLFYFILFSFIFFVFYLKFVRKVKFKWKTFFKKGFSPTRNKFGVYCYCGKQGKGKTYSVVEFLKNECKGKKIYANIKTLRDVDYTYFSGFDNLLKIQDTKCVIFYDEIFTALTKSSKIDNRVLSFLSQMRKKEIIFLTTAQEWLEINITLRRYCRYQIECNMINFLGIGILIKEMYDAELLKWSNDDNEYIAPLVDTTVSKCNISIAKSYDTFEQIET